MKVLVDTSVWIEYFRSPSKLSPESFQLLDSLILEDRVSIIRAIEAELLPGQLSSSLEKEVRSIFTTLSHLDPKWEEESFWEDLIELGRKARKESLGIPGVIDRILILVALKNKVSLWTLDKKLKKLASALKIETI